MLGHVPASINDYAQMTRQFPTVCALASGWYILAIGVLLPWLLVIALCGAARVLRWRTACLAGIGWLPFLALVIADPHDVLWSMID